MHAPHTILPTEGIPAEGIYGGSRLLNYGLGWVVREYKGRVVIQHGGAIDGMRASAALIPEERLGVVVLTNRGGQTLPEAVVNRIFDAYLGTPPHDWSAELLQTQKALDQQEKDAEAKLEKDRVKGTKPSLTPEEYAGTYRDELYGELRVEAEKGGLLLRYGPAFVGELVHWHHDTFRVVWRDRSLGKALATFRLDRKGKTDEVRLSLPDWGDAPAFRRSREAPSEPVITLKPDELRRFVGVYRRAAPPLEVAVELVGDKLKLVTLGEPVATLAPIKPARFRVEGGTSYLEFELGDDGKVKQATYERGEAPAAVLTPKKK
jgi:hypothetical protein